MYEQIVYHEMLCIERIKNENAIEKEKHKFD